MQIKVPHVHRVTVKGRVYYYHRPTRTRLKAEPGTPAFLVEIERLQAKRADAALPDTFGELVTFYRAAPEFLTLAERTRSDYQRVFNYLKHLASVALSELTQPAIISIRDRAFRKHKRRFANYVVQVLSVVLQWGVPRGRAALNAAAGVPLIRRPRDARKVNRAWAESELNAVLQAAPQELRTAILLGVFFRQGDVLRLTWNCYDGHAIELRQGKTGAVVWVPAPRELQAALAISKRRSPIIVLGARGRPFTAAGFRSRFFGLIRSLTAAGKVAPGLTFHGLRHSAGKMLADAGCDTRTIAAILGHATEAMSAHYSREADQRRRAVVGIKAWERNRKRTVKRSRTGV